MRLPGFAALISAFRAGLLPPLAMTYAQQSTTASTGNPLTVTGGVQVFAGTDTVAGGPYTFLSSGTEADPIIQSDASENLLISPPVGGGFVKIQDPVTPTVIASFIRSGGNNIFDMGSPGGNFRISNSTITIYSAIATAGLGVEPIYAGPPVQHKTNAAPTSITLTPAATVGMYVIKVGVLVKTATAISLKLKATYTGADGVAKTDIIWLQLNATGAATNGVATADRASGQLVILTDASGGVITVADNSGTYTTCEYWLEASINQVAAT